MGGKMIPTEKQIKKIKYSNSYIGVYVTKRGIRAVINEWEKIRRVNI